MARSTKTSQPQSTAQRLSSLLKSVRDIMRKDKGLNGDADRLPMLTWMMFLKFLDDQETIRQTEAKLKGGSFRTRIEAPYRWQDWGAVTSPTGDDLIAFINNDEATRPDGSRGPGLLKYLRNFQSEAPGEPRRVIGDIFKGVVNRMVNGYLLRDVLTKLNEIHFTSSEETHTLSQLYESLLKEMRDAAGDAGEFYTPRPVVRFMVKALDPKLGETVLDPACGTGGFLVEAFEHLKQGAKDTQDLELLQRSSVRGGEAKTLPYLLAQMNLILHGLASPQIDSGNSLRFKLSDIGPKDQVDMVLANPPFGGEEETSVQQNFPSGLQTSETALLFLQLIMRRLHDKTPVQRGGRAAIVVPNGTLFGDGVAAKIKKELLDNFNLHTVVRLGNGVFAPYTSIPTNLLFFEKGTPTEDIWYCELPLPEGRKNYTKTQPIQFEEFGGLLEWWNNRAENQRAWRVSAKFVAANGYNLDIKNPNAPTDFEHLPPEQLLADIMAKEERILEILRELSLSLNSPDKVNS